MENVQPFPRVFIQMPMVFLQLREYIDNTEDYINIQVTYNCTKVRLVSCAFYITQL